VSDWSEVWSFTTFDSPPDVPALVSPANGATNIAVDTTFVWGASERAQNYQLQIAADEGFTNLAVDMSGIADTSANVGGLDYSTDYFWRVRAVNLAGASDWSSVRGFRTIIQAPATVTLFSPSNGAQNIATDTLLVWFVADRAESYHVQVSSESDFSDLVVDSMGVTTNQMSLSDLEEDTVYYWRVRGRNLNGFGNWSAVWNFKRKMWSLSTAWPVKYRRSFHLSRIIRIRLTRQQRYASDYPLHRMYTLKYIICSASGLQR
jgi:hypothetical protein